MTPRAASLADYLERSAERFPERTAVVDPDGSSLSYRQLEANAERIAAFLAAKGVRPGDRVALVLPKSAQSVTAIFGILKARGAYVPIDCTAPAERIQTILADGQMRVVVAHRRYAGVLENAHDPLDLVIWVGATGEEMETARIPNGVNWDDVLASDAGPVSRSGRNRDDLAYMLYTSGSTGIPKGVMLSQGNALSFVDWCTTVFHPTADDRFSSHAPFHFDLSVLDLFVPIKHGASVHLISVETGRNPKELAALIAERRLTVWYSTPSILRLLSSFGSLPQFDYSDLRLVLFAGEVFPVKHLRELTELWPRPRYFNLYGPTETNVCTYAETPSVIPEERNEPYPIGPACSHCEALVLDSEGRVVAPGEEGLLYISGESVFQGYWNRPKENEAAFISREGKRWYLTGDVVREEPGQGFLYLGRRDRMVKRHGYRIELDDIECALYKHERLSEATVVAVSAGSGVRIVAYLAAAASPPPSILELKMFCAKHLPTYMNPDVFVFLQSLPRTSTNKVDYQALRSMALSGAA